MNARRERSTIRSKVVDATLRLIDKYTGPLAKAAEQTKYQVNFMKRQANQMKRSGQNIAKVGSTLQKNLTTPILGVLGASGKMADSFEKDMGQVNTLLDNKKHLENYKKTAIQVSNDVGIALGTVSKGVYQMISSIGDSGKKTQDIFAISAKAAKGGGSSVAESVALISSAMKGYDSVNAKTAQSISDMAFQTQKLGVTTYKELAASMQPLFPLGNSLSVSYQELFGSMATLTGVTGNTAEVTTQMKGLFTGLLKPTDAMSELMKKYGYQNGQAMIKAKGMSGVLQILKKETGGQSDKMAKLFSNSRALTAALALTGSQYDTFKEKTKQMNQASGSTEKALKDMKTSTTEIKKAVNSAKNSLTVFGGSVLKVVAPSISKGAAKLAELAKKFSQLSPETQKFIVKAALVVAAVGPVIKVFGTMKKNIGDLAGSVLNLYGQFAKAGSISAFLGPGGKIVLILAAIAAAALAVYTIWKNWDKITGTLKKVGVSIQENFGKAMNTAKDGMAKASKKWGGYIDGMKKSVSGAHKKVVGFGNYVKTSFQKSVSEGAAKAKKQWNRDVASMKKAASNAHKGIVGFGKSTQSHLKALGGYVKGGFKTAISVGAKLASTAFKLGFLDDVKIIINGSKKVLKGFNTFLSGVFKGDWRKAWRGIVDVYKSIFETIGEIAKKPLNGIISMMNTVIGGLNHIKIPSWVPKFGGKGINIAKIPALAKGTLNWSGGLAQVHEKGGELIELPHGTRVYPHDESIRRAREDGKKTYRIEKFADTIIVREEADIHKIAKALADELEAVPV